MKNSKGVTMIELVIVMIIIVLIAGFAVFNGRSSIDKAEVAEIYSEISNVKSAVNGVMVQMNLEGKEKDNGWLTSFYNASGDGWYEIYGAEKSEYATSDVRKNLGLDEIKRSYQVNFETGEVQLSVPVQLFDRTVQTYDDIRALAESDKI